jgi:hypothetical protein
MSALGSDAIGDTYVSELNLSKLSKGIDYLTSDFVGDIELDHAHVRRAEHGIFVVDHSEGEWALSQSFPRWLLIASQATV